MHDAILFKILQRKHRYRNPESRLDIPADFMPADEEYASAERYVGQLAARGIAYAHPGHENYPAQFCRMPEPPLFFEYSGPPVWKTSALLAVVGSREINPLSELWMKHHLQEFVRDRRAGVVSGGARGVDQLSHLIAVKNEVPTVFVLPGGLAQLYPRSLEKFRAYGSDRPLCFLSEFEVEQVPHKSFFYFRNRLIAALGRATLVVQASQKSGSLLTIHHCLQMGRPVLTVPAHPELPGFDGNLKLLHEGAFPVSRARDLHDFWLGESWPN